MPRPVRSLLTVLMDLLVIVAVILVLRVVFEFFGTLAAQSWGKGLIALTGPVVLPVAVKTYATPYGGRFDVAACVTIVLLLAIEWALGIARRAS